jgi:DNA-binding HxlR family transcriptional regulator
MVPMSEPAADALERALDVVGDRWTLRIVAGLAGGRRRYGDLATGLGIATNVLADRLRRLERAGLVIAQPYQRRPLRMEYELTDDGVRLAGVIAALSAWAAERDGGSGTRPRHDACGTELELRWWCPTCERVDAGRSDGDAAGGDLVWL